MAASSAIQGGNNCVSCCRQTIRMAQQSLTTKTQSHLPMLPICDFKEQGSDLRRHLVSAHDSVMKGQEKPEPRLGRGRRVDAGRGDVVKLTGHAPDSAYQDIYGRKPDLQNRRLSDPLPRRSVQPPSAEPRRSASMPLFLPEPPVRRMSFPTASVKASRPPSR